MPFNWQASHQASFPSIISSAMESGNGACVTIRQWKIEIAVTRISGDIIEIGDFYTMMGAIQMFLHLQCYHGNLFSVEWLFAHPSSRHLLLDRVIILFVSLASPSPGLRIVVLV
jgi:hypothetical protein